MSKVVFAGRTRQDFSGPVVFSVCIYILTHGCSVTLFFFSFQPDTSLGPESELRVSGAGHGQFSREHTTFHGTTTSHVPRALMGGNTSRAAPTLQGGGPVNTAVQHYKVAQQKQAMEEHHNAAIAALVRFCGITGCSAWDNFEKAQEEVHRSYHAVVSSVEAAARGQHATAHKVMLAYQRRFAAVIMGALFPGNTLSGGGGFPSVVVRRDGELVLRDHQRFKCRNAVDAFKVEHPAVFTNKSYVVGVLLSDGEVYCLELPKLKAWLKLSSLYVTPMFVEGTTLPREQYDGLSAVLAAYDFMAPMLGMDGAPSEWWSHVRMALLSSAGLVILQGTGVNMATGASLIASTVLGSLGWRLGNTKAIVGSLAISAVGAIAQPEWTSMAAVLWSVVRAPIGASVARFLPSLSPYGPSIVKPWQPPDAPSVVGRVAGAGHGAGAGAEN